MLLTDQDPSRALPTGLDLDGVHEILRSLEYPRFVTVPSHSLSGAHHQPQSGPRRSRSGSAIRPFAQRRADQGSTLVGAHGNRRATTRRQTPSGGRKAMPKPFVMTSAWMSISAQPIPMVPVRSAMPRTV